jgi:hypothetical protein
MRRALLQGFSLGCGAGTPRAMATAWPQQQAPLTRGPRHGRRQETARIGRTPFQSVISALKTHHGYLAGLVAPRAALGRVVSVGLRACEGLTP